MKSLAVALAASLAIVASGGTAGAQISDDVVKIGVLTDMSSLYADATGKGSLAAVQMAVADYGGKVKGKPIEVIAADHQNKPDVGVNIARNWYDNEKVDARATPRATASLPSVMAMWPGSGSVLSATARCSMSVMPTATIARTRI